MCAVVARRCAGVLEGACCVQRAASQTGYNQGSGSRVWCAQARSPRRGRAAGAPAATTCRGSASSSGPQSAARRPRRRRRRRRTVGCDRRRVGGHPQPPAMSETRWLRPMPAGSPEASLSARPCRELRPASANQPRLGRAGRPRRPCLRRSGLLLTSVQQRFAGGQRVQGADGLHVARAALALPSRCPCAATVLTARRRRPQTSARKGEKAGRFQLAANGAATGLSTATIACAGACLPGFSGRCLSVCAAPRGNPKSCASDERRMLCSSALSALLGALPSTCAPDV